MSTTRPFAADDRGPDSGGSAHEGGHGDRRARTPHAGSRSRVRAASCRAPGTSPGRRCASWGWLPADTADHRAAAEDVLLVVSELVTNACLHAGGPEELRLRRGSKSLRLEVVDGGPGDPAPRTPHRAGRPGGHGMFIVQRLCLDWGVVRRTDGPGKTVWAELAGPS